LPWILK
jgi:tetratricopeptide (TPR) repeat protein